MQMYEATDLLLRRRPLQPDVPSLIWQIGNVETRLHSTRISRPQRFERLCTHLLQFYPANQELIAFYSSPHPLMRSTKLRIALRDLTEQAHKLHAGYTLLIPPVHERSIEDLELLKNLDSVEHLWQMTDDPNA